MQGVERTEIEVVARDLASAVLSNVLGQVKALGASTENMVAVTGAADRQLSGFVSQLAGYATALAGVAAVVSTVKEGLAFDQVLEDTRLGIAAVTGTFTQFSDATGRVLAGNEAFNASLAASEKIQQQLKLAALQTTAQYGQLVEAFQVATGPMTRAHIALEDQVKAAQRLTQAMGALGVPMAQLGIEMRQFFQGDYARSRLLQSLGITGDEIRSLAASGGLMDLLLRKTESMGIAGARAADTFTGLTSNLKDFKEQLEGEATVGLFEALKAAMRDISGMLVKLTPDGAVFNKELVGAIKGIADGAAKLIPSLVDVGKALVEIGLAGGKTLVDVLVDLLPVIQAFAKLAEAVAYLLDKFGALVVEGYVVAKMFGALTAAGNAWLLKEAEIAVATGTCSTAAVALSRDITALNGALAITATAAGGAALVALGLLASGFTGLAWNNALAKDAEEKYQVVLAETTARLMAHADVNLDTATAEKLLALHGAERANVLDLMKTKYGLILDPMKAYALALEDVRKLSQTPIVPDTDPELVRKLGLEFRKLTDDINLIGKSGWSAKFEQEAQRSAAALEKLNYDRRKAQPQDRWAYDPLINAEMRKHAAEVGELNADFYNAQVKREADLSKLRSEAHLAYVSDSARDVAAIKQRTEQEIAASAERVRMAQKDSRDWLNVFADESQRQQLIVEKGNAEFLALVRKNGEQWKQTEADVAKSVAQATGDVLGLIEKEIQDKYAALKQGNARDFAKGLIDTDEFLARAATLRQGLAAETDLMYDDVRAKNEAIEGAWGDLWKRITKYATGSVSEMRTYLGKFANYLQDFGSTLNDGVLLGLVQIQQQVPTFVDTVGHAITDLWSSLGQAFESSFYDLISGKLDDLKSVFQSFGDSLRRILAKTVSEMVQTWIAGQLKMGKATGTEGGTPPFDENGNPLPQTPTQQGGTFGSLLGGAAIGYGIGSALGSLSGAPGWQTGASIGGTAGGIIGSIIPGLGTAIGAAIGTVLGGILGAAFAENTEQTVKIYARGEIPAVRPPLPGESTYGFRDKLYTATGNLGGSLIDAYKSTGATPEERASFATAINKVIQEYLDTMHFVVSAGSQTDIQNDLNALLTGQVPKEILARLFGFQTKPVALPGITGGEETGAFDPTNNAPLTKMLRDLGFTAKAITNIASQINTRDPEAFVAYLTSLLKVVGTASNLIKNLSKSATDIFKELEDASHQSPAEVFKGYADDLKASFKELDAYTGDTQIAKAQELLDLVQKRYEEEVKYLEQLRGIIKQVTESLDAQIQTLADVGLSRGDAESRARATIATNITSIGTSKNPEDIVRWVQEAQKAVQFLMDGIIQRLNVAQALLADVNGLVDKFRGVNQPADQTISGFFTEYTKFQYLLSDAASKSGDAQLEAIGKVKNAAEDLYARQAQLLSSIKANMSGLWQSINQQKLDLTYSGLGDDQARAGYILDRIKRLQGQIPDAKSPEAIKAITDEIQSLVGKYFGLFKEDDPKRAAAIAALQNMLDYTEDLAHNAYEKMYADIDAANKKIATSLEGIGGLLEKAMTDLKGELVALRLQLISLGVTALSSLRGVATDVVAAMKDLVPEINTLKQRFLDLSGALGPSSEETGGGSIGFVIGLGEGAHDAALAAGELATALRDLKREITGENQAGGGNGATPATATSRGLTVGAVSAYLQRNPNATQRFVGV